MKNKSVRMKIINPDCAGIDVGSRSHYVAIGQQSGQVKEFGVYASDLQELSKWLLQNSISSVAMESTGNYWQNLYIELVSKGLIVVLANGKFTKSMNRKKTDVMDCQWIQKLHSLGLLNSSFLPDNKTERLRTLCRHRQNMIEMKADTSNKMQKYLKLLNFRLDIVVRDVTGLTGIKIIDQICKGNLDPKSLAEFRHYNCRKSEEEIAKALVSNKREDYLFGLKQEYERYKFYLSKIDQCDKRVAKYLKNITSSGKEKPEAKPYKRINKNGIKGIDLNIVSYHYFGGIDLFQIPGVSHSTILALMSEIGADGFKKFPTAKHFASWLRLAPNNKISGGKMLSHRVPKGSNRLKVALRNAANAVGNLKDTQLSSFFKKIAFKKGRQKAITATARKIAIIIYNMIVKKQPYNPPEQYLFLDQKRKQIAHIRTKIAKFGINPDEIGIFSRPEYEAKYHAKVAAVNQCIT